MPEELKNNKQNPVDALFKEALTDHKVKPSSGVWKGISTRYLDPLFKKKLGNTGLLLVSSLLIIVLGALFFTLQEKNTQPDHMHKAYNNITASAKNNTVKVDKTSDNQTLNKNSKIYDKPKKSGTISGKKNNKFESAKKPEIKIAASTQLIKKQWTTNSAEPILNNEILKQEKSNKSRNFKTSYPLFKIEYLSVKGIETIPGKPVKLNMLPLKFDPLIPKDNYIKRANLQFGIHGNAGLNYYKGRTHKPYFSGEVNIAYYTSRLWIETGAGILHEKDNGNYVVNYESYDSVGYYYEINSFSYDPATETVTFNKTVKNVYDSIEHKTLRNTTTKYTYLHIPLGVKYKLGKFKRIDIYARTGGIFQLLLLKNEPEVKELPSEVSINNMYNEVPTRIKTSWKFYAGLQFRYLISSKLWFDLEPVYMQYIQTPYDKNEKFNAKRPYSIGLRTGISFNF